MNCIIMLKLNIMNKLPMTCSQDKILEPFCTTLQHYPKNEAIVKVVLRALRCLADGSSDVNRIASAAYLRTLMLVYSNFDNDAKVTTLFVQLICSLSAIESCQTAIIQSGIIAKTVHSTQAFPEAHDLLFAVAGSISHQALRGTAVCASEKPSTSSTRSRCCWRRVL